MTCETCNNQFNIDKHYKNNPFSKYDFEGGFYSIQKLDFDDTIFF